MSDRTNGQGIVRLSLNVPAVERLLAGDQELEVHLRHQVKEQVFDNFANRIMENPSVKMMVDSTTESVRKLFVEMCEAQIGKIKIDYSGSRSFELRPEFKVKLTELINRTIEPAVVQIVKEQTQRIVEIWNLASDAKIEAALNQNIEKRINDGINLRLAAAAKVKE